MKKNLKMELLNSEVENQVQGGYFGMPSGAGGFADTFITQKAMNDIEEEMRGSSNFGMQSANLGDLMMLDNVWLQNAGDIILYCTTYEIRQCNVIEKRKCHVVETR